MHRTIEPAILYFGTPVVLISTRNPDGSTNIAPNSSAWWLGWNCMLGLDGSSQSTENLKREGECVLNLPSGDMVGYVDKIARTTGRKNVPLHKKALGYYYLGDKLKTMGLTGTPSLSVAAQRIAECPVQLEARVNRCHRFGADNPKNAVPIFSFDLAVEKVHVDESLLKEENSDHIDPDCWHPLIMCFRNYYSTHASLQPSRLDSGPEELYAPWKRKGLTRKLAEWVLSTSTARYR